MRTKQDVQLELLKEIDEICEQNNLKYFLFSRNALNVYLNHTIKNGARVVCIAMTQGDIERFCEIVEKNNDGSRYVEGLFNNPRCNYNYVSYGNSNTTDFNAIKSNYNNNHGIRIRIYTIKAELAEGTKANLTRETKVRKLLNTRVINPKFWFIGIALKILYAIYAVLGGPKKYAKKVRNDRFIDSFDDIQNYDEVSVSKNVIRSSSLTGTKKVDVDGYQLSVPENFEEFLLDCFGESYQERNVIARNQRFRNIIDTEHSYDEVIADSDGTIRDARCLHEEIIWKRMWCKRERDTVADVWRLVKMTQKQVEYIHFFEETGETLFAYNLDVQEEFDLLVEQINPIIRTLIKYSKFGMTFSITPEADALIQEVMIRNEKTLAVSKIKLLKNKKIYVK